MKEKNITMFTYSLDPMKDDIYVSIGFISNFIGISSVRYNTPRKLNNFL